MAQYGYFTPVTPSCPYSSAPPLVSNDEQGPQARAVREGEAAPRDPRELLLAPKKYY